MRLGDTTAAFQSQDTGKLGSWEGMVEKEDVQPEQ